MSSSLVAAAIEHYVDRGLPDMALTNCHAEGLDSIVLYAEENPKRLIRMFVAWHRNHSLDRLYRDDGHYQIAGHTHRFNLTLTPLVGELWNIGLRLTDEEDDSLVPIYRHRYRRGSIDQAPELAFESKCWLDRMDRTVLRPDQPSLSMKNWESHTVQVPKTDKCTLTAWLVEEGSDITNDSLFFSEIKNPTLDMTGLYEPMDRDEAEAIVGLVLRHMRGDQ